MKCDNCEARPNGIIRDYGVIVCENSDVWKGNNNND